MSPDRLEKTMQKFNLAQERQRNDDENKPKTPRKPSSACAGSDFS
ncbi:TPA: hypothetical protein ACN36C_004200 [Vibrio parahaemolyticus]